MTTTVVHIKYPYDVYIGRPRGNNPWNWGNPFSITLSHSRAQVIAEFEDWYLISSDPRAQWMRAHIHELKGKRLGCFCKPEACHGDVLARYADGHN